MRHYAFALLFCAIGVSTWSGALASRERDTDANIKNHWGLLIAGSAGWGNYRHQADVAHAFQVLKRGGLKDEHIVVMMADDLVDYPDNPHPGKLFNRPGGPDVYAGINIDYRGEDVNATNFLSVLVGDAASMKGIGTGRVVDSGPDDRVFVYFADHGGPGILGMPTGRFLYADEFVAALYNKSEANGFKEMVVYVEACESGSIFKGMLDDDLSIYATTAANDHESSWGTYCPGMAPEPPEEFNTCLGDLYSVAWMENSDLKNLTVETLLQQYDAVRERTSNNYTYITGSHVQQFGALSIDAEIAGDYLGMGNEGAGSNSSADALHAAAPQPQASAVLQRDADLLPLRQQLRLAAPGSAAHAAVHAALQTELAARRAIDDRVAAAVQLLLQQQQQQRFAQRAGASAGCASCAGAAALRRRAVLELQGAAFAEEVEALVYEVLPWEEGLPLVDDWDCLRGMVNAYEAACGPLGQYGMKHGRAFANLCNSGMQPPQYHAALLDVCRRDATLAQASVATS